MIYWLIAATVWRSSWPRSPRHVIKRKCSRRWRAVPLFACVAKRRPRATTWAAVARATASPGAPRAGQRSPTSTATVNGSDALKNHSLPVPAITKKTPRSFSFNFYQYTIRLALFQITPIVCISFFFLSFILLIIIIWHSSDSIKYNQSSTLGSRAVLPNVSHNKHQVEVNGFSVMSCFMRVFHRERKIYSSLFSIVYKIPVFISIAFSRRETEKEGEGERKKKRSAGSIIILTILRLLCMGRIFLSISVLSPRNVGKCWKIFQIPNPPPQPR